MMFPVRFPRSRRRFPPLKRCLSYAGIAVGLLLLANAAVWTAYRGRLFPRTHVLNSSVGNMSYDSADRAIKALDILPGSIQFSYADKHASMTLTDLGVSKNASRSVEAGRRRSWLPIVDLFKRFDLPAPISVDDAVFNQAVTHLSETFDKPPSDAALVIDGEAVTVQHETDGYRLDGRKLKRLLYAALDAGNGRISVPVVTVQPKITSTDLSTEHDTLVRQLSSAITIRYSGKTRQPARSDIAKWFVRSGASYAVSGDMVRQYIVSVGTGFGIKVQDADQTAAAVADAVRQGRSADVTLTAVTAHKRYVYCVSAKGVSTEYLAALKDKLLATLNDSRGWSLDGSVSFAEVASSCNFTVWLSSADLMPTFGTICDSIWSCRVGSNVVINFDRWEGASSAWNAAGGSLEDYRYMVINHEVGHWLGFGHRHCGGAGQPAPIMQQQSIDLEGCTFNPWPTPGELADFRAKLGF